MKYLINETLCEKVEVEGFEYYLTSDEINHPCYVLTDTYKLVEVNEHNEDYYHQLNCSKIIATNNSSLDLPQVVDEVDVADKTVARQVWQKGYNKAKETFEYTKEDMVNFCNFKEDYWATLTLDEFMDDTKSDEELLDIWNEQRIIKLNTK